MLHGICHIEHEISSYLTNLHIQFFRGSGINVLSVR